MAQRRIIIVITWLLIIGSGFSAGASESTRSELMIQVDGAQLEAQLISPSVSDEPMGVVIFVGGSGSGAFDDYAGGLNRELVEDIFLPRGYAVLYYNKRGIGKSTGNWRWGSIERRAEDTMAVAAYLRELPDVDPGKIGLVGHSQGGWVVFHAGGLDSSLAFVISLAGPTVSVTEQDRKREEISLVCEEFSEEDIAKRLSKLDRSHKLKIKVGRWFPFFQLRLSSNLYSYDPSQSLRSMIMPTFMVFAEHDSMVPPEQNRRRFDEIFSAGSPDNFTWYVEADSDHLFRTTDTVCFDYFQSLEAPFSPGTQDTIAHWVDSLNLR
jgi:dipeptidyl aminopeptidase/acylaminoacyl peptidase